MLWVLILGAILIWAPPAAITHRTLFERAHSQINPKPCSVNGVEGTCMFVYECIKTEGHHVGMCVDNFMFGSCCSHNATVNDLVSHETRPNVLYSPSTSQSSLRPQSPTLSTKPHSSSLLSSKIRPSKPSSFITRTTKRPPITLVKLSSSSTTTTTTTTQPPRPSFGPKPWTQKPLSSFITSSSTSLSSLRPSSTTYKPIHSSPIGNLPPSTIRPYSSAYDLIATSKPTQKTNTTWTTLSSVSSTSSPFTMDTAESSSSWATSKPGWSSFQSSNELFTIAHVSKPEIHTSGKPNSYVSRPSWQSSTESFFVTRPRPSSNLSQRPRPTRRPVSESTTESPTSSSTISSTTTVASSSSTTISSTTLASSSSTTTHPPPSDTMTTLVSSSSSYPSTTIFPGSENYQHTGECGLAALSPRPEMRIVGGKNAPFGGWPWQVSVRRTSFFGFSSTHRCGGALINENWIATAGHCVDDLLTSQIRIRVGEYDFSSVQEPLPFVEKAVSRKIVHPKYNFYTYEYDLALVRLETSLEFQPHISPICLPASDDLLIGENATVTGWGRLSEGGTLPSVLQQVSVPIVSNDKCKSMFLRAGRHEFIPEIFLCAGYENGGQDSCQGDSGGPLQVKGKNGRYFLAGIISWGIGCAEANLPGVCTRISKFVPWILENVT